MPNAAVEAARYMPGCTVSTWVTMPSNGAIDHGVVELALCLVHARLGLQVVGHRADVDVGIALKLGELHLGHRLQRASPRC